MRSCGMTMRSLPLLLLMLVVVAQVACRHPKWWLPPRNQTVFQRRLVTQLVPSSCVLLQPSLAPCRNLRHLSPSPTLSVSATRMPEAVVGGSPEMEMVPSEQSPSGEARAWTDWSWSWDPATTLTKVLLHTVRRSDPEVVVTVSVKGCRPARLPFDLPLCHNSSMATIHATTANIAATTATIAATRASSLLHTVVYTNEEV